MGFTPQILLGVHSAFGDSKGGVGAFFNIPSITTDIKQLSSKDFDEKCDPRSSSKDNDSNDNNKNNKNELDIPDILSSLTLTNIVPQVEVNAGAFAELAVDIANNKNFHEELSQEVTITSKVWDLPTACLSFDKEKGGFENAQVAISKATESAAAGNDGKEQKGKDDEKSGAMVVVDRESRIGAWVCGIVMLVCLVIWL